ncbi:MAG: deoxyribodipyrimidine photo-lyase [Bryobacteraceae bacterium]
MKKPVLVWFRLDLRLEDNPALLAAAESGSPVIPIFIWAPEEEEPWPPGAASCWWLHQSLKSLQAFLDSQGSRLILRLGPTVATLKQLIAETGANAVFWNRRYEPAIIARDAAVQKALDVEGIQVQSFNSALLFEPWKPFQVFSPFWRACLNQPEPAAPAAAPERLPANFIWPDSLDLSDLRLEPQIDWAAGIRAAWTPGEAGSTSELELFLKNGLENYPSDRNRPDKRGTSRLSPHLHFGEISPRKIWHALKNAKRTGTAEAVVSYLSELGWREFAHHLLFHFPETTNKPLRSEFAAFPWRVDGALLKAWQSGRTGYPLVDAGMRELWTTGWMHNRVRMVVASFLTKHLRISWEEGAYWFWDTLVDADLANNTLGWQWTFGSGADAAPFFRIFNPTRQSERFDPNRDYIRRWIPDLGGKDYPLPVVNHEQARREALASFEQMRKKSSAS